uniref:Uncharacterized protein n=1 Tax=Anguilla anguilla TaxID=7936 RepID=A0A0E9TPZ6_ANGAN
MPVLSHAISPASALHATPPIQPKMMT